MLTASSVAKEENVLMTKRKISADDELAKLRNDKKFKTQVSDITKLPIEVLLVIRYVNPKSAGIFRQLSKQLNYIFRSNFHMEMPIERFLEMYQKYGNAEHLFPDFVEFLFRGKANDLWFMAEWCCEKGFANLLKYIRPHFPDLIVSDNDWKSLYETAEKNNQRMIMRLLERWRMNLTVYIPFLGAVTTGNVENLKSLAESLDPIDLKKIIRGYHYEAFRLAAGNGHLDILIQLQEWSGPDEMREMIRVDNYRAFHRVAFYGDLCTMCQLKEWSTKEESKKMIQSNNYFAFRYAAMNGHLKILDQLREWSSEKELEEMIKVSYNGSLGKKVLSKMDKWREEINSQNE